MAQWRRSSTRISSSGPASRSLAFTAAGPTGLATAVCATARGVEHDVKLSDHTNQTQRDVEQRRRLGGERRGKNEARAGRAGRAFAAGRSSGRGGPRSFGVLGGSGGKRCPRERSELGKLLRRRRQRHVGFGGNRVFPQCPRRIGCARAR